MRIAGFVPDLMDRSRWSAVEHVGDPEALVGVDADLVVVDLDRLPALDLVGRIGAPTLGFCSHVHDELRLAAIEAGCDEVVARSRVGRVLADRLDAWPGPDEASPRDGTGR